MISTRFGRYIVWLVLAVIFSIGLLLRLQTIMYTEVDRPIRADAVDYIACLLYTSDAADDLLQVEMSGVGGCL